MMSNYPKLPSTLPGVKRTRTVNTTSLGAEALDKLINDGIPFPSIISIDERRNRQYTRTITRLFIAEGYKTGQKVIVISPRTGEAEKFLEEIPIEMNGNGGTDASPLANAGTSEELRIAWRFQNAPKIDSSIGGGKGNKFDLAKSLSEDDVIASNLVIPHCVRSYSALWTLLEGIFKSPEVDIHANGEKHPVRIIINELGSPLFGDSNEFTKLAVKCRAFLMQSTAVIMWTYDGHQLQQNVLNNIQTLSDTVLIFHPLPDTNKTVEAPTNSKIAGRLEIVKLPRLYGTTLSRPEACDYSYKETRHALEIRKLHLDPEGDGFDTSSVAPILPTMQQLGVLADDLED